MASVKQRRAGPALLFLLPGSRAHETMSSVSCLSGRCLRVDNGRAAAPHGSTSPGYRPWDTSPSELHRSHWPFERPDQAREVHQPSIRAPCVASRRSRAPAHEGIRGGRAPSKPSAVPSAAKAFLALTPSSNLHEPTVVPSRVLVTGRNRGWRGRRRPAPLGIIGGSVAQHRPENARQPAGQRDRRHRPPPPRGDPERPRP
jgi:hypothetical protein